MEDTIMFNKLLIILLFVVACIQTISAEIEWQSTSTMSPTGSRYQSVAVTDTYAPFGNILPSDHIITRPLYAPQEDDDDWDFEDDDLPEYPEGPLPIGEGIASSIVMAGAYVLLQRRKRLSSQSANPVMDI